MSDQAQQEDDGLVEFSDDTKPPLEKPKKPNKET